MTYKVQDKTHMQLRFSRAAYAFFTWEIQFRFYVMSTLSVRTFSITGKQQQLQELQ